MIDVVVDVGKSVVDLPKNCLVEFHIRSFRSSFYERNYRISDCMAIGSDDI